MHNANRQTWAALSACLSLSLLFSGCSKKSDSPTPVKPVETLACKPMLETNVSTSQPIHSYEYDAQGRISVFTSTQLYTDRTTVTYEGDDIVFLLQEGGNSPASPPLRYSMSGGRITKAIGYVTDYTGSPLGDSAAYSYEGERLIKIRRYDRLSGQPLLIAQDSIVYADGLPVVIYTKARDYAGAALYERRTNYYYDTPEVAFSPYSPLALAPGIELSKVRRMVKDIGSYVKSTTYSGAVSEGAGDTASFVSSYDAKGNVEQVRVYKQTGSFIENYVSRFTYQCE